jgi:hypothetical protein
MIPYEELCQALDRYNARRRNAEELANLEQAPDDAVPDEPSLAGAVPQDDAAVEAAMAQAAMEGMIPDDGEQAAGGEPVGQTDDGAEQPMAQEAAAAEAPEGEGFAEQPKENTHEIDVDDVMIEDRLAEDKIPGD